MWRAELRSNEGRLAEIMDSFLPRPSERSRPGDDPVKVLNEYALYVNDDSICHFPPARTYEGAAAGAAMVAGDHECFRELGFTDGENCILHRRMDLDDFEQKTRSWLARPAELAELARRGSEMVRERYTHEAVAARLHSEIRARWEGEKDPPGPGEV
jgi:spore maturation protein CgeB